MVHAGQTHYPAEGAAKPVARMGTRPLTPRELEALRAMAAGKSSLKIGDSLFITESAVKAHVNNILSKLGVSDRTQAVTTAHKRGIVRLD